MFRNFLIFALFFPTLFLISKSAISQKTYHIPLVQIVPDTSAGELYGACNSKEKSRKAYCKGYLDGAWQMGTLLKNRIIMRALKREECFGKVGKLDKEKIYAAIIEEAKLLNEQKRVIYDGAESAVYRIFLGRFSCTFYPFLWKK